ncbi:hypothetical protein PHYSODRAFT_476708 [Phytophthora sojae]|uniref:Exodeoxyribonuclease X-like C-terminal domain-containing protein n=1 Tax=Phytophthora sojae (strain P6497) TaxID=1094619 RepID=G4YF44_PHYSP|nr:hypothetical protein PHYSODRAFT_476708 [Phytophthora sojae]EGZ27627.1 hypothetical protein PHYSODRAFT_476708 [Phytophthora sojae]|eukprot:XP_009514902.1 hypothetical protein PHYSODRAFT_476708 [Phytophthora sojae]
MSVILEFGKYKGKALEEVHDQDASYCRWLYNQQSEDSDIKRFLQGKFQDGDDSYIMRWGKHKNKSVKWIVENDTQYFNWMCKNEYIKNKCYQIIKVIRTNELWGMNTLFKKSLILRQGVLSHRPQERSHHTTIDYVACKYCSE